MCCTVETKSCGFWITCGWVKMTELFIIEWTTGIRRNKLLSNTYRCESKLQAALNMCFDSIIIIISLGKQSEQNCINVLDGYNVCVGKEEDLMLTGTWLVRLKLLAGLRFLPPALLPRLLLDALLAEFFLFLLLVVVCRVGSALRKTHKQDAHTNKKY